MNNIARRRTLPFSFALLLFAALHMTLLAAGSGRIIDEETRKPLANVFVIAKWDGHVNLGAIGKTICYDFAMTQTDADGRFSLRDWSWNINPFVTSRYRSPEIYLQGYVWSANNFLKEGQKMADSGEIKLSKYKGAKTDRLVELRSAKHGLCMRDSTSLSKLVPLYIARYEEAQHIANTPEEKKIAQDIKEYLNAITTESGSLPQNPNGSIIK